MLGWLVNKFHNKALNLLKEKYMKDMFEGIGVIQDFKYEDKKFQLTVLLDGMDRPISVSCEDIEIGPDGKMITIRSFDSDMPFVKVALNRFATRTFEIPEGAARLGVQCAAKVLGL